MSDSSRWRRLALVALLLATVALAVRWRRGHGTDEAATDPAAESDGEVSVRLNEVSVGDDLSIATGELDPTVAAEVLELNVQALETVEEAWVRDTIDAALAEDADLDEVEERLGEQVRENDVTDTAIEELENLGFRGMLDFGGGRDRDDEDASGN